MLQLMRKHARSWLMKVLLGLIIIVFIFYFGSMRGHKEAEAVAVIGSKSISYGEVINEYGNLVDVYRRYYGDTLNEEALKRLDLKKQALDNLVNQAVLMQMAGDLKISVSEDELRSSILSYPAFQRDGAFSQQAYQQVLRSQKLTPDGFEEMQRRGLVISRMHGLVTDSIKISDAELWDLYRIQNEKMSLDFIKVGPDKFKSRIKVAEADLEAYLKAHGESFRVPEKWRLEYLLFSGSDYGARAAVRPEEIADHYERLKRVKSSGELPPLAQVQGKLAEEIKFQKGMDAAHRDSLDARDAIYQENNFEEYARKNSLKVHSTGLISRNSIPGQLKNIRELDQNLSGLRKDETTPILSDDRGYYIFRLVEQKPSYVPGLAEVRGAVEKAYRDQESAVMAKTEADNILKRLQAGEDFRKAAAESGLAVGRTDFFTPGGAIPVLGSAPELSQSVSGLSSNSPYPDSPHRIASDYVIVKFRDRQESDPRDFNAKKDALRSYLVRMKQNAVFQAWLDDKKTELAQKGKLKILKDAAEL